MVPLIAVGAAALWGASKVSDAKDNLRRANDINSQAAAIANDSKAEVDRAHGNMKKFLDIVGETKMDLMSGIYDDFACTAGKIHRKFKVNHDTAGLRELEEFGFNEKILNEMQTLSNEAKRLISTPEFDSADGGSYAAIGLLGAGVLGLGGSLIAGPAMAIYGMMKSDEAEAALYEASSKLDEARLYQERCKNMCVLFSAIGARGRQINNLLIDLNKYFEPAVDNMNNIAYRRNYNFTGASIQEKMPIYYTFQIANTIKNIIDTAIIQDDWSINPMLDTPIIKAQENIKLLKS